LARAGWTIGAHTVTHSNVALVGAARAEAEIAGSPDALASAIGPPVTHFCYPNSRRHDPYLGPEGTDVPRRLGFDSAAPSPARPPGPGADPFLLPRLGVSPRLAPVADLAAAVERQRLAA